MIGRMQNISIDWLLLWGVRAAIGLTLLVPLVIGPFGLTVALYPKAAFFRALVQIAFIFYIILLYRNPRQYMPRFSLLSWALSAFVAALFLASVFGISFTQSFWGDVQRAEGVIFYIHLLVFFFVVSSTFQKRTEWMWLLRGVVGAAGISAAIGIWQGLGNTFLFQLDPGRASGTFSNPVFFGNYMSLAIFVGALVFLEEQKKFFKIGVGLIIVLCGAALMLSGTRGAWLGFIAGVVTFALLVLFSSGRNKKTILKVGGAAVGTILLAGILVLNVPWVQEQTVFQRATNLPLGELSSRLVGWSIAFDAWKERPLFGWGPESFKFLFDKFFRAEYLESIRQTTFFDRAHNQPLHLLATTGLWGAGTYLFSLGVFVWLSRKYPWKKNSFLRHPFAAFALVAFVATSFAQNIFSFDTISSWVLLFLLAAFIHATQRKQEKPNAVVLSQGKQRAFGVFLLLSYIIFAATLMYQLNIKPTYASMAIIQGAKLEQPEPLQALEFYKKGLTQKTVHDASFRVVIAERLLARYDEEWERPQARKGIVEMIAGLKPQVENDFEQFIRIHASGYELLFGMNEKIYLFSGNPVALSEMERVITEAIAVNPQTPRFYHLAGRAAIISGAEDKGEELHKQAYELTPKHFRDIFEYRFQLGLSYTKINKKEQAAQNFQKALNARYEFRMEDVSKPYDFKDAAFRAKIAALFCELGQVDTCVHLLEQGKEIYPNHIYIFEENLASIYEQLSDSGE